MIKCFCLTIVIVACLLGVGRAQEEDRGSVIARKIALEQKKRDEVLWQALARRDFKGFVALVGRDGDVRLNPLDWVAALPSARDQAQILALFWQEGPLWIHDEGHTGHIAELGYQYNIQDRLMQLTYQVLGQTPPVLPSKRLSLITRQEVQDLTARLQAVR